MCHMRDEGNFLMQPTAGCAITWYLCAMIVESLVLERK